MKRTSILISSALLAALLAACGTSDQPTGQAGPTSQPPPTARPSLAATATPPASTAIAKINARERISAIGEVQAARDADLVFIVSGTVGEVLVEEGDVVTPTQVLARLDMRRFDQQIRQAQASLESAQASLDGLSRSPRPDEVEAAQAQVRSAQAALEQVNAGAKVEDLTSAEAALAQSQVSLQSQRDQLSKAKTDAEAQVQNAAESLVKAQAAYAQAKSDWDFVQETGKNPTNPDSVNPQTGKKTGNNVTDSQRQQYYAAYVQAEASLRQAEQAVDRAVVAAEQARKAEVTGIELAEQQVTQAQSSLDKLRRPADQDRVASAQAQLSSAQSQLRGLSAAPTEADVRRANASIAQAQVSLEAAQLDRVDAELRAPFGGVVAAVNIAPGDSSATGGAAAIQIVDVSELHIDVQVSDIDIARVRPGLPAEAAIEALPDQIFTGKVSYIAPTATVSGNVRSYLVRIALHDLEGLRPGMSARVQIEVGR